MARHARDQEEDRREGEGPGDARARAAQARHRRRTQERLRALIAPWWQRDPAALSLELSALRDAGFRPTPAITPAGLLQLAVPGPTGRHYLLAFDESYLRGGGVHAYQLSSDGSRAEQLSSFFPQAAPGAIDALRRATSLSVVVRIADQRVLTPMVWESASKGESGELELGWTPYGDAYATLAVTGLDRSAEFGDAARPLRASFPVPVRGLWARVDAPTREPRSVAHEVAWVERRLAAAHGLSPASVRERLQREIGALIEGRDAWPNWRFVRRSATGKPLALQRAFCEPVGLPERAPHAGALRGKRVALVGCGAVGWAVATLLARSGVRSLALYDDDRIHYSNLTRLGALPAQVGTPKVTSLADWLRAITPGIDARPTIAEVGTRAGTSGLVRGEPDLIVNVTGEERSTLETNRAALVLGRPALFAWVTNGVYAGRILRVRPFESACYECVRQSAPPPLNAVGPIVAGTPWQGSVIDVEAFAAAVAQAAVRTLLGEVVSPSNPDHVVLDFAETVPVASVRHDVRDGRCAECGTGRGAL